MGLRAIPDPLPALPGGQVALRPLAVDDGTAWLRYLGEPVVSRYGGIDPVHNPAESIVQTTLDAVAAGRALRWAIVLHRDGPLIGTIGFNELDHYNRRAAMGYDVAPEHWGRGVASAAARALVAFGFEALDLHRIQADVHPENTASIRVLEKCVFRLDGRLRDYRLIRGQFSDMLLYSLLAQDWRRSRP